MATTDVAIASVTAILKEMRNNQTDTLDMNWQTPDGRSVLVTVRPVPENKRGQEASLLVRVSKKG